MVRRLGLWSDRVKANQRWFGELGVVLLTLSLGWGGGALLLADERETATAGSAESGQLAEQGSVGSGSVRASASGDGAKAGKGRMMIMTPEREAAAITFIRQHHPELAALLLNLKESSPREFERAIRDLYRTSERLAAVQERDSLAYELELQLWKARSRAQLLSARLHMQDDEELRKELRAALREEYDSRLLVLEHDRERLAGRLENLDAQLGQLRANRERAVERQFESTMKAVRAAAAKADRAGREVLQKKNASQKRPAQKKPVPQKPVPK